MLHIVCNNYYKKQKGHSSVMSFFDFFSFGKNWLGRHLANSEEGVYRREGEKRTNREKREGMKELIQRRVWSWTDLKRCGDNRTTQPISSWWRKASQSWWHFDSLISSLCRCHKYLNFFSLDIFF